MRVKRRATWRNHTGNQAVEPLGICWPETLADLVGLVAEARRLETTVRAVGSGHSWSDVALCTGLVAETTKLGRPLPLTAMRDDGSLFRAEAGMKIRALNAELARSGRALENLGGYDGQSIAGVVSTATHGSGLSFGPLSDAVRSLDVVAGDGAVHRIEPSDGPTDPGEFARELPDWTLHQDGGWFDAARVGIGCLGLIYAVTLAVVPAFELTERRRATTWEEARALISDPEGLRTHLHVEVYLNPYERDGRRRALITTRELPDPGADPGSRHRSRLLELVAGRRTTYRLLNLVTDLAPGWTPFLLDKAIEGLEREAYTNAGYKVFNIGAANAALAYSSEIGVPVDAAGTHVRAVERIIEIAERRRTAGGVYHTAPIALRFVRATDACLAMMQGRETMMIELILLTDTEGGYELLGTYEDQLYRFGGRPHWGQVNTLTGSHDFLRSPAMYPETYAAWQRIRAQLDPDDVFAGPFTKRLGLTR
ncbi:MAG TPA: D-arabinono-1,4-lactone oxidase [Solirubrobacteraceae bacterium]|nr:D-arabinono-1,4-lactone oxidase [Solirubrobacteraceae bacterium]